MLNHVETLGRACGLWSETRIFHELLLGERKICGKWIENLFPNTNYHEFTTDYPTIGGIESTSTLSLSSTFFNVAIKTKRDEVFPRL